MIVFFIFLFDHLSSPFHHHIILDLPSFYLSIMLLMFARISLEVFRYAYVASLGTLHRQCDGLNAMIWR